MRKLGAASYFLGRHEIQYFGKDDKIECARRPIYWQFRLTKTDLRPVAHPCSCPRYGDRAHVECQHMITLSRERLAEISGRAADFQNRGKYAVGQRCDRRGALGTLIGTGGEVPRIFRLTVEIIEHPAAGARISGAQGKAPVR